MILLVQIFINVGMLLSYVSNYAFAGLPAHLGWRVMFAMGVIPPVFIAAGVFFMPESPRWLAMRGRHGDARAVLVRTSDTPAEADLRLAEIKQAVADADAAQQQQAASHGGGGGVWTELLRPSPSVRRILTCAIGLQFFVQASGVDAILLYSPLVFKAVGVASDSAAIGATVAIGAVKTCFILVGMLLTDRVGRRPLLLASTAGVAATTASLALTLRLASGGGAAPAVVAACLASVLAVVATYSVGYGSVVNTYSAEILPLRLRAQGSGLGVAVNRLTCGLVGMTFISLAGGITMAGCFFLYAGVTAAAFVFVYALLPETRGRTLEDMGVLFDK